MKEFKNKVAVITGAASGIGRALAGYCAKEGMKVVLADVEAQALAQAEKELKETGADVLSVVCDVSKESDIESLAQKTLDCFGGVNLLFNNAGVGAGTSVWESTIEDWKWVLGVNLWGVIYATKVFVPIMLKQETECHVVNTASLAGLTTAPGNGIYSATKHAIVNISETLYTELKMMNSQIGVSVVCPGFVKTRIMEAYRNRPQDLSNTSQTLDIPPQYQAIYQWMHQAVLNGMPPEQLAEKVFDAIKNEQFYIIPGDELKPFIKARMDNILNGCNPTIMEGA